MRTKTISLSFPQHQFIWFPNVSWNVPVSTFPHYQYGWQNQKTTGNIIHVGDYYHIQSTVTYAYYGTDGTYLGQESTSGLYNKPYSVSVPYNFGDYYIEGNKIRAGLYPKQDETLNVYYKYVPPIVYYNTSNPYATTYYANGYEYVPNYIPPVVYYTPTYDGYGYVGGYSYSSGYAYSSGGYSSSSGAYYPNYVPQSAYYSKEAQLVAEEGGNNSSKVNYSTDKEDNSLLNFGESVWSSSLGESLKNVTRFAPWQISSFVDYGTQIVSGEDANDALNKTAVHAGLSAVGDVAGEYVAEEIGGMLGTALAPGVGTIIGIGIGAALGVGFDFIYDKIKKRRR